jgi:hypothetical protein
MGRCSEAAYQPQAVETRDMHFQRNWFESKIRIAHDTLKWILSGVSALLTLGFVLLLEIA